MPEQTSAGQAQARKMLLGRPTKKFTILLIGVVLVASGLVAAIVVQHFRRVVAEPEALLDHLPEGANISIGAFRQTASRDGKNEWFLSASSAHYIDQKKKVVLENIDMTFFLQDGRKVRMTADHGVLKTETKDVDVSGNVTVTQGDIRLTTDQTVYRHDQRLLHADKPVRIDSGMYHLKADRMTMDLAADSIEFSGEVEGRFVDNGL